MAVTLLKMDGANPNLAGQLKRDDIWSCKRCGWTYPNAHPSAKVRRNHKKNCGKIKGFEIKEHNRSLEGSLEGSSLEYASSDDDNGNGQATDFCMDKSGDFTDYPSCLLHEAIAKNGRIELETETEMEMERKTAIQPIEIELVDSNAIVLKSKEGGDFESSIVSEKEELLPPPGGDKYKIASQTEMNKDDHKCMENAILSSEKLKEEKSNENEGHSTKQEENMVDSSLQINSNEEITTCKEDIATSGSLPHAQALVIERVLESDNCHISIEINLDKSQYKNIKDVPETRVNPDLNVLNKEEKEKKEEVEGDQEEEVAIHVQDSLGKILGGDNISPHKEGEIMVDSLVHEDSISTSFNESSENIDTRIEDIETVGILSNPQDLVIERASESEDCPKSTEINSDKFQCSIKDVPETMIVNHDINVGKEEEEVQATILAQEMLEKSLKNDNLPHKEEEKIAGSSTIPNGSISPSLSQHNEKITTLTEDIATKEMLSHPKDIKIEMVLDQSEDCEKSKEMNFDKSECSTEVVPEIRVNCDINVDKEEEEEEEDEVAIPVQESSGNSLVDDDSPHKEEREGSSQNSSTPSTDIPQILCLGEEKVDECINIVAATELKETGMLSSPLPNSELSEMNQERDLLDGWKPSSDLNQIEKDESFNEKNDGNKLEMDDKISNSFDHHVNQESSTLAVLDIPSPPPSDNLVIMKRDCPLVDAEEKEEKCQFTMPTSPKMDISAHKNLEGNADYGKALPTTTKEVPIMASKEKESKILRFHSGAIEGGVGSLKIIGDVVESSDTNILRKCRSQGEYSSVGHRELLQSKSYARSSTFAKVLSMEDMSFSIYTDAPESLETSSISDGYESMDDAPFNTSQPFLRSVKEMEMGLDGKPDHMMSSSSSSSCSNSTSNSSSSRSSPSPNQQGPATLDASVLRIGPKDHVGDLSQVKDYYCEETGVNADHTLKEEVNPRAPLQTLLAKEVTEAEAVVAVAVAAVGSPKAKKKQQQKQQKSTIIAGKELGSPKKAKKKGWSFLKFCICSPSVK